MENFEMELGKAFVDVVLPFLKIFFLGIILLIIGIFMFIDAFLFDLPVDKLLCSQRRETGKIQIFQGAIGFLLSCSGFVLVCYSILLYNRIP